jgi:hypothetical protein
MKFCAIGALVSVLAMASHASATTYVYQGRPGGTGGSIESISASWTPSNNRLTWSVTWTDQLTNGFSLAISPGPNPKNNPGQLAMLYFDAKDPGDISVSAFGYNGLGAVTSFVDGDGSTPGNQAPDFIAGTEGTADGSWVLDASLTDAGGKRTLSLTIDASVIQGHVPLYPDPDGEPWTGVSFAERIGFWFHGRRGLTTSYGADGRLLSWGGSYGGHSDVSNLVTITVVPLPPAAWAGLIGLAGAAVLRRRVG